MGRLLNGRKEDNACSLINIFVSLKELGRRKRRKAFVIQIQRIHQFLLSNYKELLETCEIKVKGQQLDEIIIQFGNVSTNFT